MKRHYSLLLHIAIAVLAAYFLFFSFSLLRAGSAFVYTDVARDHLLMDLLSKKQFFFIGGRTSLEGVFHGPIWQYVGMPGFLLSNGNPYGMQWYWIAMTLVFFVALYFALRDIFDTPTALISILLLSINMLVLKQFFTNPIFAFFCIPFFLYTLVKYVQTKHVLFLIVHVLLVGMIIQAEMFVGVPLLALSGIAVLYQLYKTKKFAHILAFAFLAIPLSTFILFEVRHHFLQLQGIINYATGRKDQFPDHKSIYVIALQKWELITRGDLGVFLFGQFDSLNTLVVIAFTMYLVPFFSKRLRDSRVILILYFFVGYFLMTFMLKDTLLFHYYYPLMSLPIILFASLHAKINRYFYVTIIVLAILVGAHVSQEVAYSAGQIVQTSEDDWNFLSSVAAVPFKGPESSFGYYVYAPDVYAYQLKYAMVYQTRIHPEKMVFPLSKQRVLYLVIAAPTGTGKELSIADWKRQKVKLDKDTAPVAVWPMPHGYLVEEYLLTDAQKAIPADFDMSDMLYFR